MALLDVAPTTVAGAAALLRHAFEVSERNDWAWPDKLGDDGDGEPWPALLSRHVANALEKLT